MTQELLGPSPTKNLSQSLSSDGLEGAGCLVLFVAIAGVIVFFFLGTSTQRDIYFRVFSHPEGPQGSYATVAVKEFMVDRRFFQRDTYVITLIGTGHLPDKSDKNVAGLAAGSGLVYTLECEPYFWNQCGPLSPDSTYYARWTSPDHARLAISELAKDKEGKSWVSQEKMQFYDLKRWERRDTLQVSPPGKPTEIYINAGFSFRYPENWRVEENKKDKQWSATIAPPEAHLGTWVTHGLFVGHVVPISSTSPATLEGAFEQSKANFQKGGLNFLDSSKTEISVGGRQGLTISYTESSPLSVGEIGHLIVVRDDGDGYYYFLMFCPNDEQTYIYGPVFNKLLETVKFEKTK